MRRWLSGLGSSLRDLDGILRGEATRLAALRTGRIDVSVRGLTLVLVLLAMLYGLCMGSFALLRDDGPVPMQLLATTLKVPALFFLTLLITFPSLYVFNALVGSRLNVQAVMQLLIAALGVNLALLASLGPIVAFFSVSTTSYHFMVLLNVVVFALAGVMGLKFLLQTLNRLSIAERVLPPPVPEGSENNPTGADDDASETDDAERPAVTPTEPGALDPLEGHVLGEHVKVVFRIWVIVFGLVGAQMGWVLRPFIGDPTLPFAWFRERESNFFQAVWESIAALFM